jgi:hypothetical protein
MASNNISGSLTLEDVKKSLNFETENVFLLLFFLSEVLEN